MRMWHICALAAVLVGANCSGVEDLYGNLGYANGEQSESSESHENVLLPAEESSEMVEKRRSRKFSVDERSGKNTRVSRCTTYSDRTRSCTKQGQTSECCPGYVCRCNLFKSECHCRQPLLFG